MKTLSRFSIMFFLLDVVISVLGSCSCQRYMSVRITVHQKSVVLKLVSKISRNIFGLASN